MFPLQIKISFSKFVKISEEGWWIVETTLTPLRLSTFSKAITYKAVELSNPVVGSSRNSIEGLVSNSTPIDVLFLSPPEIPLIKEFPTLVFLHLVSPNSFIKLFTLSTF